MTVIRAISDEPGHLFFSFSGRPADDLPDEIAQRFPSIISAARAGRDRSAPAREIGIGRGWIGRVAHGWSLPSCAIKVARRAWGYAAKVVTASRKRESRGLH